MLCYFVFTISLECRYYCLMYIKGNIASKMFIFHNWAIEEWEISTSYINLSDFVIFHYTTLRILFFLNYICFISLETQWNYIQL